MAPKHKHLVAYRVPGHFNATAACGRRVNWLTGTADSLESVTCDQCHAAARNAALLEFTFPIKITAKKEA